jgi:hypothetical protein
MNLRNAIAMCLLACFTLPAAIAQTTSPPDLSILFTGYLLGYYRVPDIQTADFQENCPIPPSDEDSARARLLRNINDARNPSTILVGMGDNFAVQLYSRTYLAGSSLRPKPRNSDDPKWGNEKASKAIGDNVGCFLSLAHYDAIVPGKEDFYFGPERLRQIAKRLAAVPMTSTDLAAVHMLAANLVVQTSYVDALAKIPDSQKSLKFAPGLPDGLKVGEISDGGTVLPFLRKITVKSAAEKEYNFYLCSGKRGFPDDFTCNVPTDLTQDQTSGDNDMPEKNYSLPENADLQAGENYQLCARGRDGTTQGALPHCVRFNVAVPFLQSCEDWECKDNQYDKPYKYLAAQNVVIFGVVDPDLESLIGRDNLSWKNTDKRLKTEVAALDPLKSLQQAEQLFAHDCAQKLLDQRCSEVKPRKVLLAQMSRGNAEELAENLDFDAVIAMARPLEHATTNRTVIFNPDPDSGEYRSVVVVPWQGTASKTETRGKDTDKTATLFNPLRRLDLHDREPEKRVWTLSGERLAMQTEDWCPEETDLNPLAEGRLLAEDGLHWQASAGSHAPDDENGCKPPAGSDAFVNFTLKTMREKTSADVALMQKRDFYAGPFSHAQAESAVSAVAEGIERVLWTGDILQVVLASGDTLAKVLKESDSFDRQDLQSTQENVEPGRGLYTHGIRKTDDGQYLIDGSVLDPKRLYSVATTNHIMAGDTGYPELSDPTLSSKNLPPPPKGKDEEGRRISELVCVDLVSPSISQRGWEFVIRFFRGSTGGAPAECAATAGGVGDSFLGTSQLWRRLEGATESWPGRPRVGSAEPAGMAILSGARLVQLSGVDEQHVGTGAG